MRLNNRVAVVTGGGGGLGEGICLSLAREGADLVVSDLDMASAEGVAKKVKKTERGALAFKTDVRKIQQCRELIDTSLREMGHIDILVCCAGVVAGVGDGIRNVETGDRVVVKPLAQCGECYWCLRGQHSLCPGVMERSIGLTPIYDGAFAEYVRIPHPDEMLFNLPPTVSLEEAALIEPLAPSLHSVRLSRFKPGDRAVIIGTGTIGLGVLQFLKLGGATRIIVLEPSAVKSELAGKMGADTVLNPGSRQEDLTKEIFGLTDGVGADIVFECAGVPVAFQACEQYVKSGGQVMLLGINDREVTVNPFMTVIREVEMKGAAAYYDEFPYVIEFLEKKKLDTASMISDVIPLGDLVEKGFRRLLSSGDLVKVLVKP